MSFSMAWSRAQKIISDQCLGNKNMLGKLLAQSLNWFSEQISMSLNQNSKFSQQSHENINFFEWAICIFKKTNFFLDETRQVSFFPESLKRKLNKILRAH